VARFREEHSKKKPPCRGNPPAALAHPGQGILDEVRAACNPDTRVRVLAHRSRIASE
jgi:hypothetical protein